MISKNCILAAAFALAAVSARAQVVDQQQLSDTSTISARTTTGYSVGQSFTAGMTGQLTGISAGFFNAFSGNATLRIYAGPNLTGTPLATLTVSILSVNNSTGPTVRQAFSVNHWTGFSVPVVSGQQYSFEIVPASGLPDPFAVAGGGSYSRGQMIVKDPSGEYPISGISMVFQTRVL